MKKVLVLVFVLFSSASAVGLDKEVEFQRINEKAWIHRSFEIISGARIPSNGMIFITASGAVLVDTAWNDLQTEKIIKFIQNDLKKTIKGCIITHYHQDRAGGIDKVIENKIPLYMNHLTYSLLNLNIKNVPYIDISNQTISIDSMTFSCDYLGEAHSKDNITVWNNQTKILFGGCIIKSSDSTTIGNIQDANLEEWKSVIQKLKEKYSFAAIVVPGHGNFGDKQLFDSTRALIR